MTFWRKTREVFKESVIDAFQIGSSFEGVHAFRRRAIRILLIFFICVLILNFALTKVFNPHLTYHDLISLAIGGILVLAILNLHHLKRFFWLWLVLSSIFFSFVVMMGFVDQTGLQVGALLLTVIMPLVGVYFIGRIGAIGCWVMGAIAYAILFSYSLSQPPPNTYFGGYSQIYDLLIMGLLGLTLSMIIALTLNDAIMRALTIARSNLERARISEMERTRFFGAVSHEIRNTLNGIFGIASSLMRTELSDEARSKVELIQVSGNSLIHVLNDTLEVTRLETGNLELSSDAVDLHALFLQTAARWRFSAENKGLAFVDLLAPDVIRWVQTDATRIRQVLDNLLSNALKFTQTGEVRMSLTADSTEDEKAILRFQVEDTGCGIHPDRAEHIFEPYRQESSSTFARYGGTGLGLYICRLLAGQMNGNIRLDSSSGGMTRFVFEIPASPCADPSSNAERRTETDLQGLQKLKTIAVDDRLPNRRYLETIFASWDLGIVTAESGPKCLDLMKSEYFDVLLLDLNMPDMSGQELLQKIRKLDGRNRDITVIVVSAEGHDEQRKLLMSMGVEVFITKPVTPAMLWSALIKACEGGKLPATGKSATIRP